MRIRLMAAMTMTGSTAKQASRNLIGGSGNDTYVLADVSSRRIGVLGLSDSYDTVQEAPDGGIDTVEVQAALRSNGIGYTTSYTLGDNIENGVVQGNKAFNLTGNGLNNILTGNAAANTLDGGEGKDALNGGDGADVLRGGSGDDTYVLADVSSRRVGVLGFSDSYDTVQEGPNGGTDTVLVQAALRSNGLGYTTSYTLTDNVENGVVQGDRAFDLTGNGLDNILTGNAAVNALDGGAGKDTLVGGGGADVLRGWSERRYLLRGRCKRLRSLRTLVEGTDTVHTHLAGYNLGANVENLVFTKEAIDGPSHFEANGNGLDNVISVHESVAAGRFPVATAELFGFDGNDTLTGGNAARGSSGDVLDGGAGDDKLRIVSATDTLRGGIGRTCSWWPRRGQARWRRWQRHPLRRQCRHRRPGR